MSPPGDIGRGRVTLQRRHESHLCPHAETRPHSCRARSGADLGKQELSP